MGLDIKNLSSESFSDIIQQTSDKRANYTRVFFRNQGKSLDEFVANLKNDPFNLTIDSSDNKSLALGISELQKKLGFLEIDGPKGCDGKFGPYTNKKYQEYLLTEKSLSSRVELKGEVDAAASPDDNPETSDDPPGKTPDEDPPEETPDPSLEKETELSEVPIEETVVIGDSLTAGMANVKGFDGAIKLWRGGSSTNSILPEFLNFLSTNEEAIKEGKIKRVVIALGANDIENFGRREGGQEIDTVEAIEGRFQEMFERGKQAGLSIIACTIPQSDTTERVANWQKIHHGKYPYTAGEDGTLEERRHQINEFLLTQDDGEKIKVIDLHKETLDEEKYVLSTDGIHYRKGYGAMADFIKREGKIKD